MSEAIHEDVSGFGSDRLAKINAISASRKEDKEQDEDDSLAILAEQAERLNEDLAEAEREYNGDHDDDEEEVLDGDDDAEDEGVTDKAPKTVKLKVNGQEREMTMEQVIAIAQKSEAADLRLQEASRRMQEAELREAQLREFEAKAAKGQPSAQDVGKKMGSDELKQKAREYHEALLDGNDDRADELLIEIQNQGRQMPTLDESKLADNIYRTIEQRNAAEKRQAELRDAQQFFSTEFADIAKDKILYDVADKFTIEIMQENPNLSPKEVVTEAGKRTRDWYGMKSNDTRVQRKQKASGGMSGNSARRAGNPAPKPKSRSDVLNDIRAARGAATL